MKLIAKKPCSFDGRQFFIDDEIPAELVMDPVTQQRLGILAIINAEDTEDGKAQEEHSGVFFSQEEVDVMISEAVATAVSEMEQKQDADEGIIAIDVSGENEQAVCVSATREDVQTVFGIMQMNAEEGAKAVAHVMSENVLILLHAVDGRKTIKDAAKKRADVLFAPVGNADVPNAFTDVNTVTISNAAVNMEGV